MEVPSPSFTLVQIYETKIGPVFHYDLWRLDGPDSLTELDWEDALDGIVLVEWPDRLGPLRPAGRADDHAADGRRRGAGGDVDRLGGPASTSCPLGRQDAPKRRLDRRSADSLA